MRRCQGLTLIEMVICIAILAVISGIAIPTYKIIYNAALKTEARNIVNDIRHIKDLTTINNIECKIIFNKDGYEILDSKANVLKKHKFEKGVFLEDNILNRGASQVNYMQYTQDGSASVSGSLIVSQADGRKKARVSITPVTGRAIIANN